MKKLQTNLDFKRNNFLAKLVIIFLMLAQTPLLLTELNAQDNCGNLLENPVGNAPVTTGWNILQVSGNSPGFGQRPGSGFSSTYGGCGSLSWNRKSQTIDLISKGINASWLDSSPDIYVAETFSTGWTNAFCTYPSGNSLDLYYLRIELRDAGNNVLASINWGSTGVPLFAPTSGITHSHTFSGYPSGVRYIYFEDGGMDAGWWNGFYGTYMDDATVLFINPEDSDGDGTADCNDGCPTDPNKIAAGQCGCGVADTDNDGDGTANCNDGCPNDSGKTTPGICGCGLPDTDSDGDGTADCNDGCPTDPNKITAGQCGCGVADTDSDGDGTANCNDGCPNDSGKTAPGICGCGLPDTDSDGDGTADCNDGCPTDPNKILAGQCGCGVADTDSDGDGTADCNDDCPNDSGKTAPGICGCGLSDMDSDGDGAADCNDGCPTDPNKILAGQCGCGVADTDSDGDGTANCNDGCPNDSGKTAPGICGCGISDTDSDGDGTADCIDECPADPNKITAGQCGCGVADTDSDGDGTANCNDGCPNDPNKIAAGICGCGVADTDSDDDGTADCNDGCPTDPDKTTPGQCGCGNAETDSDCDGIADCNDVCPGGDDTVDANSDNIPDCSQLLNYNSYSNAWKCSNNKINICHIGDDGPITLCINKNALAAHYNHGDNIGPCTTCGNALKVLVQDKDTDGDHNHSAEDIGMETMRIVPNPASDYAEVWLEGINGSGTITLLDLNGKSIFQSKFANGQNVIKLDLTACLGFGGTYFVRLAAAEQSITTRLTIVR
ncbi:MAG: T9SS type A sorting domain-containing protein [Saprospiraceae bacterium]|nr:T9SS type A sorting domain-containing protein [Saprospiraceae bacterium]